MTLFVVIRSLHLLWDREGRQGLLPRFQMQKSLNPSPQHLMRLNAGLRRDHLSEEDLPSFGAFVVLFLASWPRQIPTAH
jgi:hypothetical protein